MSSRPDLGRLAHSCRVQLKTNAKTESWHCAIPDLRKSNLQQHCWKNFRCCTSAARQCQRSSARRYRVNRLTTKLRRKIPLRLLFLISTPVSSAYSLTWLLAYWAHNVVNSSQRSWFKINLEASHCPHSKPSSSRKLLNPFRHQVLLQKSHNSLPYFRPKLTKPLCPELCSLCSIPAAGCWDHPKPYF